MKNRRIIPWKNNGYKPGMKAIFRIRWDEKKGRWVKDNSGSFWGYYSNSK